MSNEAEHAGDRQEHELEHLAVVGREGLVAWPVPVVEPGILGGVEHVVQASLEESDLSGVEPEGGIASDENGSVPVILPTEVITEPCRLPEGTVVPDRPMLLQSYGFEIPRPSRLSMAGFLSGWVLVVLLIVGVIWYVQG